MEDRGVNPRRRPTTLLTMLSNYSVNKPISAACNVLGIYGSLVHNKLGDENSQKPLRNPTTKQPMNHQFAQTLDNKMKFC